MKRFIVAVLLVALIAPMMVFSVDVNDLNPVKNIVLTTVGDYNMPLTARAKGMGGAGIALPGRADSFFMNPAGFAKRVNVLLPSAEVTLYHPYDLLKPGQNGGKSIVDNIIDAMQIQDEDARSKAMISAGQEFLRSLKKGEGKLLDVNASVGFNILGFAFGVNVNDSVHTFGVGKTGGLDSAIFDELNVTANLGFAWRFRLGDKMWIDAGANWRPTYKAYSYSLDGNTLIGMMSGSETPEGGNPAEELLNTLPVAAGYALPFDVGLNFSGSWWSVGVVGRNILGTYNMTAFDSINDFYPQWSSVFSNKDFQIKTPWSIDLGIGLKWDNTFFKPTIVCDIVDIPGMFTAKEFNGREMLSHIKAGAELRLLSFLDVRGGFNQGYWSVGAGLDLAIVKIDVAYFWQEFGKKVGDYGLDGLSIRVNVGYDR